MKEIDFRRVDLNLLFTFHVLMEERSVSLAAARVGLTQSALSHALSRLRELTGDPLLVKSGARMAPSPRALSLAEQIRPILRSIERILSPPTDFDPQRSERVFRVYMPDMLLPTYPRLLKAIHAHGARIGLEWISGSSTLLSEVSDGLVDAAVLPSWLKVPDGVASCPAGGFDWACYLRRGHPALERTPRSLTAREYARWPHAAVRIGRRDDANPLQERLKEAGLNRRVGVWVPQFSAIPPVVAATNLIATLPRVTMVDAARLWKLRELPCPLSIPAIPHSLIWSASLSSEPASRWLRGHILKAVMPFSVA